MVFEKKCNNCGNLLTKPGQRKFCSQSCAAKYNNNRRIRTEHSKQRTSQTLKQRFLPYCKVYFKKCRVCSRMFAWKTNNKYTCSDGCHRKRLSEKRKQYLREHAGTFNWIPNGSPNYFEQSFIDWLVQLGFKEGEDFIALKYSIHNDEQNTTYFLDLYFPELKFNIELDGTHHEKPYYLNRDTIRDEFLFRRHSIEIMRISIRDYNKRGNRQTVWNETQKKLCLVASDRFELSPQL